MNRPTPETVEVRLGERSYQVLVGYGILQSLGERLRGLDLGSVCAVITDSNVAQFYADAVLKNLTDAGFKPVLITVPAGEKSKSVTQAAAVCDRMITAGLDRKAFVLALGGGVVGDLAGFVAAIYYRGIPFVQIPTTIIAQVDSAVGGKTGVNAEGGKNLIGSFHQPRLVLADVETLRTLPPREFNEGFAEVIKHAIIRDAQLFDGLANLDRENLAPLIARNAGIKARIVTADEHETSGERALLNFGHTIGHGIEAAAGYGCYLHGEAISLGIAAASFLSMKKAGLAPAANERIIARLRAFDLPVRLPAGISTDSIVTALKKDKKFSEGKIRFVLTSKIGSAFLSSEIKLGDIVEGIESLRQDAVFS
jgi:3-dehydroquinate synthase